MPPYPKGVSGNPNGRPPKERSLTRIVERELNRRVPHGKGDRKVAKKRILAEIIVNAVTTGKIVLGDEDNPIVLTPDDWNDFMDKMLRLLGHIDGPARSETADNFLIKEKKYFIVFL